MQSLGSRHVSRVSHSYGLKRRCCISWHLVHSSLAHDGCLRSRYFPHIIDPGTCCFHLSSCPPGFDDARTGRDLVRSFDRGGLKDIV